MKKAVIAIVFLFASPAFAQAPPQAMPSKPDYSAMALQQRLMQEISLNLQTNAALLAAQDEVKKLQQELNAAKAPPAK